MEIGKLVELVKTYLPYETAMSGDRIGLQLQSSNETINNILISMEVNHKVVDEAIFLGCDLIISFHPLIFAPLLAIDESNRVGSLVTKLIKNNISLLVIHTNFDTYEYGTSRILSDLLDLKFIKFLVSDKIYTNCGMGVISEFENSLNDMEFLEKVQQVCNSPIRYNIGKSKKIKKVAIVGGSGSSFIQEAINSGADAFITSDITYHKFHDAAGKIMLVDPGHYEMEQFVALGLFDFFTNKLNRDDYSSIRLSNIITNPIHYYPDNDYKKRQIEYLINNNKCII